MRRLNENLSLKQQPVEYVIRSRRTVYNFKKGSEKII